MAIAGEHLVDKIYLIRGKKVMLDRDVVELYQVETGVLN
jgi:ORF6N domain